MKKIYIFLFCISLAALSGCAQEAQGSSQVDYEATKKMLVDLLKTDEGKKAIKEVLSDKEIQQDILIDQQVIKQTIEQQLLSEKGQKFWQTLFKDPKFSVAFAKSMRKEHEKLMKDLIKDPQYQAEVMKIMQNPQMAQKLLGLVDTQPVRKEMKRVMLETFDSPIVQAQIQEMLKKAAHEEIDQSISNKEKEATGGQESKSPQ
ncbi:spore gernimation protein GerD [Fictibacillus phosphorivorans]|uniref:Spore gernimation protein GerD n=1 Tax=Fictibacillus phosphorivorans TaxID=1221500 RepID=A0A161RV33_9BACL|nr:spore germination lipoprotein GerD [Fictibacillus phosphorivorans]KZE68200.1 spore gernimation protein GerD [Fictibacillus phosphorivorans]